MSGRVARLLSSAATNVAIGGAGAVSGVILARLLGPDDRGRLAAIQTWPIALVTLSMLGLPEACVVWVARYPETGRRSLRTATLVALASGTIFACAGWVLLPLVLSRQDRSTVELARWTLALSPLAALGGVRTQVVRSAGAFGLWNVIRILPTVLWASVVAGGLLLGIHRVRPFALGNLAAATVFVPIAWVTTRRLFQGTGWWDWKVARAMLRIGAPSAAASIPQVLNLRLDQLLLAAIVSPRLLGLYVVAVGWGSISTALLTAVGSVALPEIARSVQGNQQLVSGRVSRLGVASAAMTGLVAAPISYLFFTVVYGQAFASARTAGVLLTVGGALIGLNNILADVLRANDKSSGILKAELAGVAVTIPLLLLTLHPLGILGAAITSVIAYGVTALIELEMLASHFKTSRLEFGWASQGDFRWLVAQVRRPLFAT